MAFIRQSFLYSLFLFAPKIVSADKKPLFYDISCLGEKLKNGKRIY